MRANACPVYQCIRGKDENDEMKCLWLYKSVDGHWIATEAWKTSLDPINEGDPMFRTLDPVEDIHVRQQLQWQYFKPQTWEWEGSMTFMTYPMMAALPPTRLSRAGNDLTTVPETGSSIDMTETNAETAAATTGSSVVASADIAESQQDNVQ